MTQAKKIFEGIKGKSLFTEPVVAMPASQDMVPSYSLIQNAKDDRSKVILGALVVEANLDHVLATWMPGFARLTNSKDFTFSLKTETLRAMELIPPHILDAVDLIRGVRNDFAHNLDIATLSDLKQSGADRIKNGYSAVFGTRSSAALEQQFHDIATFATQALRAYGANIKLLRDGLTSGNYVQSLLDQQREKQLAAIDEALLKVPLNTLTLGASSIAIYPDGPMVITYTPSTPEE